MSLQVGLTSAGLGIWRGKNFQENGKGNDTGYSVRFPSGPDLPVSDNVNTVEVVIVRANTVTAGNRLRITVSAPEVTQGSQTFARFVGDAVSHLPQD